MSEHSHRIPNERIRVAIVALSVVLGLQLLRVFFPLVAFYLRVLAGLGIYGVIPWALAPFVISLAALLLLRLMGPRSLTLFGAGGVIAARLLEQVSVNSAFDLAAAFVGVMFFLWLVPALLSVIGRAFASGFLLGLALDTAVKGATTTLDLSWISATWPLLVVTLALVALGYLVFAHVPYLQEEIGRSPSAGVPLAGIGAWLFLQMLILQNQGWLGTATGWPAWATLLWIGIGNVAALTLAVRGPSRRGPVAASGIVLLGVSALSGLTGWVFALLALLGLAMSAVWLTGVTSGSDTGSPPTGASALLGVSNILFVGLVLFYYLPLQLQLPYSPDQVVLLAGVLVAIGALLIRGRREGRVASLEPAGVVAVAALLATGIHLATINRGGDPGSGYPIRVMTYNIAQGIDRQGQVNPEGIAQEIEAAGIDIVGIQEISRGGLITGSTDLVAWMTARLPLRESAWAFAEDGGNATFSRYPILSIGSDRLPTLGTLIERSYTETTIDVAGQGELTVTNTHLQNNSRDDLADEAAEDELFPVHQAQLAVIRDAWGGRALTVLLGDMNARPHWAQTRLILDAGFSDAWEAGVGPGYTTESNGAPHRIDWIFHTPDLVSVQAVVVQSGASLDHLPVVAVLDLRD